MSEEEKTLEEQTETIIDAIENETEDDVKEAFEVNHEEKPVTIDEIEEVKDLVREVRQLRGGLRGAADPNMIQKHLDNFLAALCGETPVDSNVRNSTEYWLKRLADGEGGSTKKIYCHPIRLYNTGTGAKYVFAMLIFNNDETPFTVTTFKAFLNQLYTAASDTVTIMASGYYYAGENDYITSSAYIFQNGSDSYGVHGGAYDTATLKSISGTWNQMFANAQLADGVNAIN